MMAQKSYDPPFIKYARSVTAGMQPWSIKVFPISIYESSDLLGIEGGVYILKSSSEQRLISLEFGYQDLRHGVAQGPIDFFIRSDYVASQNSSWLIDLAISYGERYDLARRGAVARFRARALSQVVKNRFTASSAIRFAIPRSSLNKTLIIFHLGIGQNLKPNEPAVLGVLSDARSKPDYTCDVAPQLIASPVARLFYFRARWKESMKPEEGS